ncbi:MAG: GIY-YIG nuclease family protein [Patescibacteria group bacterium]
MCYFVYIITNYINSVFYVGITNNIQRRIFEHKSGITNNAFSKKFRLYKLIWFNQFNNPDEAILIEKRIKGWKRYKKIDLIKTKNPNFSDMSSTFH